MFDSNPTQGLSDDYVVNRMFDLVRNGDTSTDEFARLDAAILKGLAQSYPADAEDTAPQSQTASS